MQILLLTITLSYGSSHLLRKIHAHLNTHHGINHHGHSYGNVHENTHVHVENCNHNSYLEKAPPQPLIHEYKKPPTFEYVTSTTYDKIHFPGPVSSHSGVSYGDKGDNNYYGSSYGDKHGIDISHDNKNDYGFKGNVVHKHNVKGDANSMLQMNASHQLSSSSHSNSLSFTIQKQHHPVQNNHQYAPTGGYNRPTY